MHLSENAEKEAVLPAEFSFTDYRCMLRVPIAVVIQGSPAWAEKQRMAAKCQVPAWQDEPPR